PTTPTLGWGSRRRASAIGASRGATCAWRFASSRKARTIGGLSNASRLRPPDGGGVGEPHHEPIPVEPWPSSSPELTRNRRATDWGERAGSDPPQQAEPPP